MLKCNWHPEAQTQRQLKEMLYYDIISFFDKGKVGKIFHRISCEMCKICYEYYQKDEILLYLKCKDQLKLYKFAYNNLLWTKRSLSL